MADYPISDVARRIVYTGSAGVGPYAFDFEVLEQTDIKVYKNDVLLTLTTDYTVSISSSLGTGSVTLVSAATGSDRITIVGARPVERTTDFTTGGDFFADTLNDELDSQTILVQQVAETAERSIKAPVTDPTNINMVLPINTARAGKTLAFDSNGNPVAGDPIGNWRGNWAAGTSYQNRDLIKDTTNSNVYLCTVAHTSSGSLPISTNADSAKWALVVDAAAADASADAAADSADDAAASASLANDWATKTSGAVAGGEYSAKYHAQAAASSATDAQTAENNAETAQTAAEAAQAAAESARDATLAAYDSFDDRYLGTKTADPSVDNDGNALVAGALYFNSVSGIMKLYTGSAWVAAYVSGDGFLAASSNLSDLTNADSALTNLGGTTVGKAVFKAATVSTAQQALYLEVGVDVQPYNANLTSIANLGLFKKSDSTIPAFTKTGAGTMTTSQALYVEVNGSIKTIAASTSITMPTLTAGTDYAIWAKTDGTLEATSNHTSPPTANARKVGGFHYAAGGNATAQAGGNTTAQINEYSIWDLKFRPVSTDPRGMALVAGGFWMDIYLTGVDAITNGSSKYNVTIADGSSPPKISSLFGGNGSTTYGSYTWFEAAELASSFQKRLPTQRELMAAAYGTTEATASGGSDVPTTGVTGTGATSAWNVFTSKWGIIQSTGCMWIWGDDRGGPYGAASWNANTEGRGSEYNAPNAVILGGAWDNGAFCGSRCSSWVDAASNSHSNRGSRFACDHLQLD
jgi:hypothetical protein